MTLSKRSLFATLGIRDTNDKRNHTVIMLWVIMLWVIMLSVIMLSVTFYLLLCWVPLYLVSICWVPLNLVSVCWVSWRPLNILYAKYKFKYFRVNFRVNGMFHPAISLVVTRNLWVILLRKIWLFQNLVKHGSKYF